VPQQQTTAAQRPTAESAQRFAQPTLTEGDYTYTTNGFRQATITSFRKSAADAVAITNALGGHRVIGIGAYAFMVCTNLTRVAIPDGVTEIGEEAFAFCFNLADVTIPRSVTNIGERVFRCSHRLTAITVDAANENYSSLDGVLLDKRQTTLLHYPDGRAGRYVIPGSVTKIAGWAFYSCTGLTEVVISGSVTNIGESTFSRCYRMKDFTVDDTNAKFSSLRGVLFDKSQTVLLRYPGGRRGSCVIPSNATHIHNHAFDSCRILTKIMIPDSVATIGENAFKECVCLTDMRIGNGVTNIGSGAFSSCISLTRVEFKGNAPTPGTTIFRGTNKAVIYHRPGTTGWGKEFGGRPTKEWKP